MRKLLAAFVACLIVSGCATTGTTPSNVPTAQQVALRASQALYGATAAFDAASLAAKAAAPRLAPGAARSVLSALNTAYGALQLAHEAYRKGNLVAAKIQADQATALSVALKQSLVGAS